MSNQAATTRTVRASLAVPARGGRFIAAVLAFLAPSTAIAATYYVAPTGSDSAAGTQAAPFASWARAQTAAAPGDTVYFRGGTYRYTAATSTCTSATATVNAVVLSKSGTSGNPISYWAFPGETPLFDFSGISDTSKYSCRQVGVRVEADWLYLKGLELTGTLQLNNQNHESWCVYVIGGSNNKFELLNAHHNMGPGFFIQQGGNNLFLNCDSHENEDTLTSNGDGQSADGFGCHPNRAGDTGNVFRGCRAWWNSDDSWDFINSAEACTVEYSWAWYAGYKPDALNNGQPVPLSAGNGNGFKGGGYGDPQTNVPAVPPQHIVRFNAAFYNKANGLYANHEIVSPFFYDNTSFNNGTDVNMLGLNGTTVTSVGILRNNLAYSNDNHTLLSSMTNGGPIDDQHNSWDTNLKLTVSDTDFQSVAFAPPASCPAAFAAGGTPCVPPTDTRSFGGMASARQADGTLPVLPFLRLAPNSKLIDQGIDVGLPFSGAAPDLGCFESGLIFDGSDAGASSGGGSSSGGTPTGSSSGATSSSSGASSGTTSSGGTSSGGPSNGSSGGVSSSGASSGAGGPNTSSGGSSGGGATGGGASGGSGGSGGNGGSTATGSSDSGVGGGFDLANGHGANGCGCRMAERSSEAGWASLSVVVAGALWARRRRTRGDRPRHARAG
jgi:MYXO-CTERM domain-containing protein